MAGLLKFTAKEKGSLLRLIERLSVRGECYHASSNEDRLELFLPYDGKQIPAWTTELEGWPEQWENLGEVPDFQESTTAQRFERETNEYYRLRTMASVAHGFGLPVV